MPSPLPRWLPEAEAAAHVGLRKARRTLADMYSRSPTAPAYAPYFGRWPVATIQTEAGSHTIEFAWSTFDVWPELLRRPNE